MCPYCQCCKCDQDKPVKTINCCKLYLYLFFVPKLVPKGAGLTLLEVKLTNMMLFWASIGSIAMGN